MSGLIENIYPYVLGILFSGIRIVGALLVVPFYGTQLIPGMVRNITILNYTLIAMPATMAALPTEKFTGALFVYILAKELIIGFSIGALFSLVFYGAQGAGAFIDTQRGSSMGQILDPMSGQMTTTMGSLFMKIMVTLFFVGGGFLAYLGFIYQSFKIWPVFSTFPDLTTPLLPKFVLASLDGMMQKVVLICAPISIVMFLVEFGLGMMNRFAPQLNVFSLSMPIKSGVAIFMMILYMAFLFDLFDDHLLEGQRLLHMLQKILS